MSRAISSDLQTILDAPTREIDWTLDVTFPTITRLRVATAPLVLSSNTYTNDLEEVSEIRQTIEAPTDRVKCGLQNKDDVLGLHVANNLAEWQKAEAVVNRVYRSGGLQVVFEMFRGAVQQPSATDFQVSFEILADTIAPGQIVCTRTLGLACPFLFKDAKTCGYSGSETTCNHNLKSKAGCDGLGNAHDYGGTEHRYNPDTSAPGTGGNPPGGPTGCPRLDQFILIEGHGEKPVAKRVEFLTVKDRLFHPITKTFHAIKSLEIIENVAIFETVAANGARSYSSESHKLIRDRSDDLGQVVTEFKNGTPLLTLINGELKESKFIIGCTFDYGDVLKIEMLAGHIYASGNLPEKLIAAHNSKDPIDP